MSGIREPVRSDMPAGGAYLGRNDRAYVTP
jgi:hypothetical protein